MKLLIIALIYFLPTIVALVRRGRDPGTAAVINLFLGWTFIGWVVALAIACRSRVEPIVIGPQTIVLAPSVPIAPPAPNALSTPEWYIDPRRPSIERYWDGSIWTPVTRQVPKRALPSGPGNPPGGSMS
jgi:hypothetical protein